MQLSRGSNPSRPHSAPCKLPHAHTDIVRVGGCIGRTPLRRWEEGGADGGRMAGRQIAGSGRLWEDPLQAALWNSARSPSQFL